MRWSIPLAACAVACCPYRGPLIVPMVLSGPSEVLVVWPTDAETLRSLEVGPGGQRRLGPPPARSSPAEFIAEIDGLPAGLDEVLFLEPVDASDAARTRCREVASALLEARPDHGVHVQPVPIAMAAVDRRWELTRVLRHAALSARDAHGPEDWLDAIGFQFWRSARVVREYLFDGPGSPDVVLVPLAEGPAPEMAWIEVPAGTDVLPTLRRVGWDEAVLELRERRVDRRPGGWHLTEYATELAWLVPADHTGALAEDVARLASALDEVSTLYFGRLDRTLAELGGDDGLLEFVASTPVDVLLSVESGVLLRRTEPEDASRPASLR